MEKQLTVTDKSDYENQYREVATRLNLKFETAPTEFHDDLHYIFTGTEENVWVAISDLGFDQEDVADGTISVGECS